MNPKALVAIAAVAILVVAGVCVYVFVLNKDKGGDTPEPPVDHYEVFRDPQVGDKIVVEVTDVLEAKQTTTGSAEDFLKLAPYNNHGSIPSGEESVTYKGKSYSCLVYEYYDDKYYVLESGFVLKVVQEEHTILLEDTNLDIDATIDAQSVTVGSFFHYEGTGYDMEAKVTDVKSATLTYTINGYREETGESTKVIESINGGVYKYKDDDDEYTKSAVMFNYSFVDAVKYMEDLYGSALKEGEKKSSTLQTVYGERPVTAQEYIVSSSGNDIHMVLYYGQEKVLYMYSVSGTGSTGTKVTETITYTTLSCDAVTTV